MRLTWPMVGRSGETRRIQDALLDPHCAGLVVSGAVGVGKSRLVRETLAELAIAGWQTRWATATSAARTLPLGALTRWVRTTSDDGRELIRSVTEALTTTPDGGPVVVCIDDAPLLDDLSTIVVQQIIARGSAKVLLTVRKGDPVPPATQELWRGAEFEWLHLQPLDEVNTRELLTRTLRGPLDPTAAQRLWDLTRGNPLYLRNIVDQEVADARLLSHDGIWVWRGDPVLPPNLVELVESRLGTLSGPVCDVVDALAVGEPVELRALMRITGADAVEEADRRGLITYSRMFEEVEVSLAHPLYGEARRQSAPRASLRRLRGMVVAELAASERRNELQTVVRRAELSLDADIAPDADLLLEAATAAAGMLDLRLAERLSGAAIAAGGGTEARLVRAFVLSWSGNGEEAESLLAEIEMCTLSESDRARLILLRAVNRLFTLADPEAAKAVIDQTPPTSRPVRRSIAVFQGLYWALTGRPDAVLEHAGALSFDETSDHLQGRLTALALTVAHGEAGRTAAAIAAAEHGYLIPVRGFIVIADAHIDAMLLAGRVTDALTVAATMRRRALASREGPFGHAAEAVSGHAELGAGHLDAACTLLRSAVDRVTVWSAATGFPYRYRILLMTALAMRGLTGDADRIRTTLRSSWHPSWRHLDYAGAIGESWVLGAQGAVREAIHTVHVAAEEARAKGQYAAEVLCLQTATHFGDASNVERLRELDDLVEGPRAGLAARFAAALRAADGDELDRVSHEFESVGDLIGAVDSAAHAAASHRHRSLRGSALHCSARAEELAERCGGAFTPALRQAVDRLPLTDREREIAMLVGESLSNRDIATKLTVSARTVESHIYKAMAKTGATSRAELAALVAIHPSHRS
ncbi:LuxR C-terminal-related transcriptional regulator [Mycobacterium sp. pV006]|uniref:LuxR C-terminal-related transcriptional regulator n=1 Tax=Mycobacterium sp. pV006 TaxID=3238983 RepID=UPI00351AB2D2